MLGLPRAIDLEGVAAPLDILSAFEQEFERQWGHYAQLEAAGHAVDGKHRDALQTLVVLGAVREAFCAALRREPMEAVGPTQPKSPLDWNGPTRVGFMPRKPNAKSA